MLELEKLFQDGVGLKTAFLIDEEALKYKEYMDALTKKFKAISADVSLSGTRLADLVF